MRSLRSIVAAVGGDLYAGGQRANIPAPGHSPADRSVSLLLSEGRLIAHSFGGATWREILDDLRRRGLVDTKGALAACGYSSVAPALDPMLRRQAAQRLWEEAGPIRPSSLARRYAERRAIGRDLVSVNALRSHPAAPLSVYRPTQATKPALLAAITDVTGELTGVELTYLDPNGDRARSLRLSRKTVGRLPPGSAVRLDVAAEQLLVAEGVFSALSAGERFDLPAWALLSTSNLRRWAPPDGVHEVLIAGDRGDDGERSAAMLATSLRRRGVRAIVRLPSPPFGDWNDVERRRTEEG